MIHTFIYGLVDPNTGIIRYVGKSNSPQTRLAAHCYEAQNSKSRNHKNNWLKQLLDAGLVPVVVILEKCIMEVWQAREIHHIAVWKSEYLLNVKSGGQGMSTLACSAERAAKISAALKGRKRSTESIRKTATKNTGKKRTAEAKINYSISKMGSKNPNYGKVLSTEEKNRLLSYVLGVPKTEEHKRNISKSKSKQISRFSDKNIYIDSFESAKSASNVLGIPRTSITACLNKRIKKAGGFLWKYGNGA